MLRRSRLPFIALLLAAAATVSACAPRVAGGGAQKPVAPVDTASNFDPAAPVTIAVLAPQSAANEGAARLGRALVNAAQLGSNDLADPLLQLRVYDTGGDAAKARAVADQAMAEGAKLIIGPLFGANTGAIAASAAQRGVNVISFSTDSSVAGGPIFLSGFLPEVAARRITSFARARGYGAQGIFYPNTPYGRVALRGAQTGAGPALVSAVEYERTEAGIPAAASAFAARTQQTGARAILIAESGQALNFVAATLRQNGLGEGQKFLGLGEWNSRATLRNEAVAGGWFPAPDPAQMKRFVNKYRQVYGAVPPPLAVLGYDAVQIAGQLLAQARVTGSRTAFGRAELTRPQGFRGAVGPIRFGADGLGERGMAILEVSDGAFRPIDPAPPAFGLGS